MSRTLLASVIVAITILVAFLDFSTSAELIRIDSVLLPPGLMRLTNALKTAAVGHRGRGCRADHRCEFLGFHRAELLMDNEHAFGNRAFLILGASDCHGLVHFWIEKNLPEAAR